MRSQRKFILMPGKIGQVPANLSEARKIVGTVSMNKLAVGENIHFQGIGNALEFYVKRIR